VGDGRGVGVDGVVVVDGLGVELVADPISESGGLQFQSVGLRALLVKGGSGSANAILGVGGGLEEVGFLLKLLAALGVG
jgi:hypothetical protein